MKITRYTVYLLFLGFCTLKLNLFSAFCSSISENSIIIGVEKTEIASNEPFIIYLTFPSSFKKEFKVAQNLIFPDIPDLIKGQTTYQDDKELKITQWYWPRKAGQYTCPSMRFTIRDYEVYLPKTPLTVKQQKSSFSYSTTVEEDQWKENNPKIELLYTYPKTHVYERELFDMELSILVPFNNQAEWTFFDLQEQIQEINKKIGATGLLVQASLNTNIPLDTLVRNKEKFYKYTIYKGQSLSVDTSKTRIPPLSFRYICYETQVEEKGLFNKKIALHRKAVVKELSTKGLDFTFEALPEHPLKNDVAVGNFHLKAQAMKSKQSMKGFHFSFDIEGPHYPMSIHEPWSYTQIPGLHIALTKTSLSTHGNGQRTHFDYFIHSDTPKTINVKNSILWVYFNPLHKRYDTLFVDQPFQLINDINDNQDVVGEDSFLQLLYKTSNQEYSLEKDESLNRFANLIIFLLFLAISVLIFKR